MQVTLYIIPEITTQNVSTEAIKLLEIFITPQMTTGELGRNFYAMMRIETCLNYGQTFTLVECCLSSVNREWIDTLQITKPSNFFRWRQLGARYFLVYLVQLLYMFRATMCTSSDETVTHTEWKIPDTVSSPDDGHIDARNMYRSWNKYTEK